MFFKDSDRLRGEWWDLTPKLRWILSDIDYWCFKNGHKMTVTCFLRTQEEQEVLFKSGASASSTSVHQFGRGADLRVFLPLEVNQKLIDYINQKFVYDVNRPALKTILRHEGNADHIHVQVTE